MLNIIPKQVSILVPVYNHSQFVESCLDSVRDDKYKFKQLIIIDDGSKDTSSSVVNNWIEKNQKYFSTPIIFISRNNKGLTKTLNEMLDLATGEFIITLASDDYLLNDSIKKRVDFLEKHPDKYAVFSDCIVVDNDNNLKFNSCLEGMFNANKDEFKSENTLALSLILKWCVPGPVILFKREAFNIIGKYDENSVVEDRELYLKLLFNDILVFYDEVVAAYRVHGDNSIYTNSYNINEHVLLSEKKLLSSFKGINKFALKSQIYMKQSFKISKKKLPIRVLYRILGKTLEIPTKSVLIFRKMKSEKIPKT